MSYTYRIGSFNLYKYSMNSNKKLEMVAHIIADNHIDILAIQEIFSQAALDKLVKDLNMNDTGGLKWKGTWASPESKSVSAAEGYAFIWNTKRVELSRNRYKKEFQPVIHKQYPHKEVGALIRNPYYGRFVVNANEMIEFRLINTHIMFSQKRSVNEEDNHDSSLEHVSDVTMRRREFEILATKILPKVEDKTYDFYWNEKDIICRRPYTILLGDYNLNLKNSGAQDTFMTQEEQMIILKDANSEKQIVTVQSDLTTLKAHPTENENGVEYSNNFDHFTYDESRSIQTKAWAVDIPNDRNYYDGNGYDYKKDVSDHLMIVMEIAFT